jgi:hypothetical protein
VVRSGISVLVRDNRVACERESEKNSLWS